MITELDVQPVADLRLIALSLVKRWGADSRYRAEVAAMNGVVDTCEKLLGDGPATGHHVIERTAPLARIQEDLRQSVFGRASR